MRAQGLLTSPARSIPRPVGQLPTLPRLIPRHLGSRAFWNLAGMIFLVTSLEYGIEELTSIYPYEHLHHIAPALYAIPIVYGRVHFGRAGGLLTVLAAVLLWLVYHAWHGISTECLIIEVIQLGTGIIAGLVMARMVVRQVELAQDRARQSRRIQGINSALVQAVLYARDAAQRAEESSARFAALHGKCTQAEENERRRIARELHDDTIQRLILLCRGLDQVAATRRLPKTARASVTELRSAAEEMLAGVRGFCRDLRPSMLDDLGLAPALRWLVSEFQKRTGMETRFELLGNPRRLEPRKELSLFRIVQEALSNVEKHAEATAVAVEVAFEDDMIGVSVRDNGRGFEKPRSLSTLVSSGKLGLVGMHERAQLIDGSLELQSESSRGTRLSITVSG